MLHAAVCLAKSKRLWAGSALIALWLVSLAEAQPARPNPELPEHVKSHLDVVYARHENRQMRLDLFVPSEHAELMPAIVVIHGGGWLNGDKTKFRPLAQALASRGYVTAAVEYRLGGEAKFPAALHDCQLAIAWLRAHADQHRVDPNRIAVVGGSAGGHLAGLLATSGDLKQLRSSAAGDASLAVQAAIVMAGPLELGSGPVAEKSRNDPDHSNANKWLGKTIDQAPELYKLASATTHLSARTPPILFMAGELDNPQRNVATRRKLRELGIATGIQVYKDGKHGCWNRQPWFDLFVDDIDAFLTKTLQNRRPKGSVRVARQPWGELRRGADRVELHVTKPIEDVLSVPRLNNPIGTVRVHRRSSEPLKLKPLPDRWVVNLAKNQTPDVPFTVMMETVGSPRLPTKATVIGADAKGQFTLAAHDAVTTGKLIRYEPQPHKNTVGYWANEKDFCHWHLYVDQPGTFHVNILQGCGKGQGGSRVAILAADQQFEFTVEDTGHFQNFKDRRIGQLRFDKPGLVTLRIQPIKKAANAVMDVRQVRLSLVAPGR